MKLKLGDRIGWCSGREAHLKIMKKWKEDKLLTWRAKLKKKKKKLDGLNIRLISPFTGPCVIIRSWEMCVYACLCILKNTWRAKISWCQSQRRWRMPIKCVSKAGIKKTYEDTKKVEEADKEKLISIVFPQRLPFLCCI